MYLVPARTAPTLVTESTISSVASSILVILTSTSNRVFTTQPSATAAVTARPSRAFPLVVLVSRVCSSLLGDGTGKFHDAKPRWERDSGSDRDKSTKCQRGGHGFGANGKTRCHSQLTAESKQREVIRDKNGGWILSWAHMMRGEICYVASLGTSSLGAIDGRCGTLWTEKVQGNILLNMRTSKVALLTVLHLQQQCAFE